MIKGLGAYLMISEPHHEKTCLRGTNQVQHKPGLWRQLEA